MTIRQWSPPDGSTSVPRRSVLLATGATFALAGCLGSDDGSGAADAVEEYWQVLADDDLESANALVHGEVGEPALARPYAIETPVDVTVGATTGVPIEEGAALGAPRFTTEEELGEFRAVAFALRTTR